MQFTSTERVNEVMLLDFQLKPYMLKQRQTSNGTYIC